MLRHGNRARSRREFAALEARRFRAARLFAQGESQAAVARVLGVTRVTSHHWYHAWKAHGRGALKAAGRAGRKPKLTAPQLAKVDRALRAGPGAAGFRTDLWTLPRVAKVLPNLEKRRILNRIERGILNPRTAVAQEPGHAARVQHHAVGAPSGALDRDLGSYARAAPGIARRGSTPSKGQARSSRQIRFPRFLKSIDSEGHRAAYAGAPSPGHVWRLLRGLNWSLPRPARRARERDEGAIEQWKTRRWARS